MKTKKSKSRAEKPAVTWNMTTKEAEYFQSELNRVFNQMYEKGIAL